MQLYFEWDGTFRDLLIAGCNFDQWEQVLSILHDLGDFAYYPTVGEQQSFPGLPVVLGAGAAGHHLFISGWTLPLILDFSDSSTVDISFDPRDLRSSREWDDLVGLSERLASSTGGIVELGYDGGRADRWPSVTVVDNDVVWAVAT